MSDFNDQPATGSASSRRRIATYFIATCALLTGATGLFGCTSEQKPQFKSIDLTGADYAKDFRLPDQNGQVRTIKDFAGKVVVVFFGFTQCPDVCPTTLAELSQIKKTLGPDGEKLQAILVTVDPERDTPELLKAYVGNFDTGFIALRPTSAQLVELAKDYKLYYKKVEGKSPGSYSMDHSAGSYIYDTKGRIRLYSRYGSDAGGLGSDIRLLLKGS